MRFPDNEPIPLWNGPAPMAMGDSPQDIPTITAFYPREWKRNGKAVIVFPGGGYCNLTAHEGDPFAIWLAENGFTAFVCRYRICKGDRKYHHPVMLSDALRAIRMVRYHAADMKIRPDMIGAIGGSAGAHLAGCCGNLHEMGTRGSILSVSTHTRAATPTLRSTSHRCATTYRSSSARVVVIIRTMQ